MADKPIYDPSYRVKADEPDDKPISDHAGKSSRQQVFALWLTLPDGHVAPLYGVFSGAPWMNLACTCIEIPFHGDVKTNKGWIQQGAWLAVITGKRLKPIFAHVCSGRRIDIHVCTDEGGDSPVVDGVGVIPMPEEP